MWSDDYRRPSYRIDFNEDFSETTTTIFLGGSSCPQPAPQFLSRVARQGLKNSNCYENSHLNNVCILGSTSLPKYKTDDDRVKYVKTTTTTTLTCTKETMEFFQSIGQLEGLTKLELKHLNLPLSLLNCLLHQHPQLLQLIHLEKVTLSSEEESILFTPESETGDGEDRANDEVERFVANLKRLPNLLFVTSWDTFRARKKFHDDSKAPNGIGKSVALELAKLSLHKNGRTGGISIDGGRILQEYPYEYPYERHGPNLVSTNLTEMAITALKQNEGLGHLNAGCLADGQEQLQAMASEFARALCSPRCEILKRLSFRSDRCNNLPFLLEIARSAGELKVRELIVQGGLTRQQIRESIPNAFTMERLRANHCLEDFICWYKFHREEKARGLRLADEEIRMHLKLNRIHRRAGVSRSSTLQEKHPYNDVSSNDWINMFIASAEEEEWHGNAENLGAIIWCVKKAGSAGFFGGLVTSAITGTTTTAEATAAAADMDLEETEKPQECPSPPRKNAKLEYIYL